MNEHGNVYLYVCLCLCERVCVCACFCVCVCEVCGRPKVSDHLEVETVQRVYEPGEEVVLACAPGYTRSGGSRVIICTKDGEWGKVTLKCARESVVLHCCTYRT